MKRLKVAVSLGKKTDNDLLVFARHVAKSTTTSGNYPNATLLVDKVVTQTDAYENALQAAQRGGESTVAEKNNRRKSLEDAIILLASHVEDNCGGDLAKLQSSGFTAKKDGSASAAPLGELNDFDIKQEKGGIFRGKFKRATNSVSTAVRYREVGEEAWSETFYFSGSVFILEEMTPGTEYEVQLQAVGKNNKGYASPTTPWITDTAWAI
jgi:hypothetical protein